MVRAYIKLVKENMKLLTFIESFLDNQKSRLFLWVPVALAIGIGIYFSLPAEPVAWLQWVFLFLSLCLIGISYIMSYRIVRGGLVFVGLILLGFFSAQLRTSLIENSLLYKSLGMKEVQGSIDNVDHTPQGRRLLIEIQKMDDAEAPPHFKARLICKTDKEKELSIGDNIVLQAKITPVMGAPYPGAYDFRRRAFFDGISANGFVTRIISVDSPQLSYRQGFRKFRSTLTAYLAHQMPGQMGAIAAALLTGETGGLSKETRGYFADSGLAHVLAISGLHLTLIGGLAFLFFRLLLGMVPGMLLRISLFKVSAVGALLVTFFYLNLSGASIPTQRAFITFSLMMVAVLLDRNPLSLRLVAVAASLVLLLRPESLLTPSFQMSFAAVIGLIGSYEWGALKLQKHVIDSLLKKMLFYLGGIVLSSMIASLATLPFTIYHFHKFSLQAIASNLIVIPLLSFWIMPLGIVGVLIFCCGFSFPFLFDLLSTGIYHMEKVAEIAASFPGAAIYVAYLPLWGLVAFSLGALWVIIWKSPLRWIGSVGIVLFVGSFWSSITPLLFISSDAKEIGVFN